MLEQLLNKKVRIALRNPTTPAYLSKPTDAFPEGTITDININEGFIKLDTGYTIAIKYIQYIKEA